MKLLVRSKPSPPFAMETDWNAISGAECDFDRGQRIKELSKQKYGRNRFIIEQEIKSRN